MTTIFLAILVLIVVGRSLALVDRCIEGRAEARARLLRRLESL